MWLSSEHLEPRFAFVRWEKLAREDGEVNDKWVICVILCYNEFEFKGPVLKATARVL